MALKVLNNDIELLLKSMITGQIRYIQKAPIKSVDNTLLFFSDVRGLAQKVKTRPEAHDVIELCTVSELLLRYNSNSELLDYFLRHEWITLVCFPPMIMKFYRLFGNQRGNPHM